MKIYQLVSVGVVWLLYWAVGSATGDQKAESHGIIQRKIHLL